MKTQQLLTPLTNALTNMPQLGTLLNLTAVLGLLGRRRNRSSGRYGLIGGGALLAAAGVLLFTTERGRALRTSLGKQAGGLLGASAGKLLGEQAGGHPITAARVARRTSDLLGSASS